MFPQLYNNSLILRSLKIIINRIKITYFVVAYIITIILLLQAFAFSTEEGAVFPQLTMSSRQKSKK